MPPRASHNAKNQAIFRDVNDRIAELSAEWQAGEMEIFCECSRTGCTGLIHVANNDYERIRRSPGWFLIIPGHLASESDRVVERHQRFDVIEVEPRIHNPAR
jgi:hypothetical protein